MIPQEASVTIPQKRVYVEEEFVGRLDELSEVEQRVQQGIEGQKIDLPVLNFWGIEGSGKTWLVHHIARTYRGRGEPTEEGGKSTFTAILDFGQFDSFEWGPRSLAALLEPAIRDIIHQTGEEVAETGADLLIEAESASARQISAEGLAQSFVDWIISLTENFIPIILFDTIEQISDDALSQVEVYFIEPLVSTDRVVLVTAGRREVARWRRFAVRSRHDAPIELGAFGPEDTDDQVKRQGFELPGELIYTYSFGLAYASQVLAMAISELSNGHGGDEEFLKENEGRLIPWLEALDAYLLRSITPGQRDVLHKLCVLRTIREGALFYLLPDMEDDVYRELLDELEATRLVWWDPESGTYTMNPSLRRLLSLRLRLQEPDTFSRRHRRAADYYSRVIEANPYDCGPLLIEAIYHLAHGYPEEASEKIEELLSPNLSADNFTVGGAENLLEQLAEDEELARALLDPLFEQIEGDVQQLYQDVKTLRLSAS